MSLSRPWDSFDACLFDIDGTLLHCSDAVHYLAFCDALSAIAGFSLNLDGIITHGNTDVGILRDAFTRAAVPEAQWRSQLPQICERMCLQVEKHRSELCVDVLPGVRRALLHLHDRGIALGVATGNLRRIGKQKLNAAGLLELFPIEAWSDHFEYRTDVFGHAIQQIHSMVHPTARILVFGDTPADIVAARAHNLPIVSVATGVYTFEQLIASQPSLCLHTLTELF